MDETVADDRLDSADVLVCSQHYRSEEDGSLITTDKKLERTDRGINYAEHEERTDFNEMKTTRSCHINFFQADEGVYSIFHSNGEETASWQFSPAGVLPGTIMRRD